MGDGTSYEVLIVEPRRIVPKTDQDVDDLVKETLDWAATTGTIISEAEVRQSVELSRLFEVVYLRPFTDDEMAERW